MYDVNNIFAKIIRKEVPCSLIYEDDSIMSFHDINKQAKVHALIIPKQPFVSYQDFIQKANPELILHFFKTIDTIAHKLKIEDSYKLITNHGKAMGQVVFHFHVHLLSNNL